MSDKIADRAPIGRNTVERSYYAATLAWDTDVIRSAIVSRNRAYLFAVVCLALVVVAVVAVAALTPLKRVEMVVLSYNEQTGTLRKVNLSDDATRITSDEVYIKSQIYNFILARETWDPADLATRAEYVRARLPPELVGEYNEQLNRSYSQAAVNGSGGQVRRSVRVRTISFLNKHTAHVLFVTSDRPAASGAPEQTREWAAVVSFAFAPRPVLEDEAFANPFGFRVTGYRRDTSTPE